MINTQTQIDSLIDLAVIQRTELKQLIESLPQLRDHLSSEIERNLEEIEPAIRSELEQFVAARALDTQAKTSAELGAKLDAMARNLESTTAAKYSVLMAERAQNATLLAQAEARIAEAASALPGAVKGIVTDELARFPRAGEIDQLRKEFAEPRGLNPRGRWQVGETYNKLDLVSYNGDSYVSNIDGNSEKPSRSSAAWTLSAARGNGGAGGGVTSMTDLVPVPANGELLIGNGSAFVNATLTAGTGISISNGPGSITINATDGNITLDDGTAASPSLNFTNEPTTGLFRASANVMGFAVAGVSRATMTTSGVTVTGTITPSGSLHAAAGSVSNPSIAFNADQNTGLYNIGADNIGAAVGGVKVLDVASTGLTVTGALGATSLTAPAATDLTLAGGTAGTNSVVVSNTLAASSAIIGAFKVGNGTAATNVAIGGGNVNAGGTLTNAGNVSLGNSTLLIDTVTGYTTFGGRVRWSDASGFRAVASTAGMFSAGGIYYLGNYDAATGLKLTLSTGAAEFTDKLLVSSTTEATTSAGVGALTTAGGIHAAKRIVSDSTEASTSSTTGAGIFAGGIFAGKASVFAGPVSMGSTTAGTSTAGLLVNLGDNNYGRYARIGNTSGSAGRGAIISQLRISNYDDVFFGSNLVSVPLADTSKTLESSSYAGMVIKGGGDIDWVANSTSTAGAAITPTVRMSLSSAGVLSATGTITASSSGASPAKMGMGFAGFAEFSHATGFGAAGTYALIQDSTGETFLNTASGKSLNLRVANTNALTLTSTTATFAGAINLSASGQANAKQIITNTDSASYSHFNLVSGVSQTATLYQFGSTYTTAGRYIQGCAVLEASGAGGLNLATSAATPLRFYTNGDNLRGSISSAGIWNITNTTAGSAGAGALVVSGGLATGAASYFGGAVTVGGLLTTSSAFGGGNQRVASLVNTGGNAFMELTGSAKAAQLLTVGATGDLYFYTAATPGSLGTLAVQLVGTTATFAGAVAIGNTTAAAVAAPSTHKVSILIGGVQYYLLASNV
jgi:hypothetical protein